MKGRPCCFVPSILLPTESFAPFHSTQALRQLAEKREPAYSVDASWLAAARPGLVITQAVCGVGPGENSSAVAAALTEAGLLSAGSETTTLVRIAACVLLSQLPRERGGLETW